MYFLLDLKTSCITLFCRVTKILILVELVLYIRVENGVAIATLVHTGIGVNSLATQCEIQMPSCMACSQEHKSTYHL